MKRLFLLGAAVAAASAITPSARADLVETNLVGGASADSAEAVAASNRSTLNPIISRFPILAGPDRRYICVITDRLDRSVCVYVPIP